MVVDDLVLVVVHSDIAKGHSPSSVNRAQTPVPGILHGPLVPSSHPPHALGPVYGLVVVDDVVEVVLVVVVVHVSAPPGHSVVPAEKYVHRSVPTYLHGPEVPDPQRSHAPSPSYGVFVVVDDTVLVVEEVVVVVERSTVHGDANGGQMWFTSSS
jgi:hypothetical protein